MFIKKVGRRYLLLHSFRDGRGKVSHRRLGHFWDELSLERQLASLPQCCPELKMDVPQLRRQALEKLKSDPSAGRVPQVQRVERIRQVTRSLLALLAEEDQGVLEQLCPELQTLRAGLPDVEDPQAANEVGRSKGWLSPRRRRFDPSDQRARRYLSALERQRIDLEQRGRWSECLEVAKQQVDSCPTDDSRLQFGHLLQKLGRSGEAIENYIRLSPRNPLRHYNLVAACWQENRASEALDHLLGGLVEDPDRLWRQDYWDDFGEFWTEEARRFTLSVLRQPLVRRRLRISQEQGIKPRTLVPTRSKVWLLEKALAAARASDLMDRRRFERRLPKARPPATNQGDFSSVSTREPMEQGELPPKASFDRGKRPPRPASIQE